MAKLYAKEGEQYVASLLVSAGYTLDTVRCPGADIVAKKDGRTLYFEIKSSIVSGKNFGNLVESEFRLIQDNPDTSYIVFVRSSGNVKRARIMRGIDFLEQVQPTRHIRYLYNADYSRLGQDINRFIIDNSSMKTARDDLT